MLLTCTHNGCGATFPKPLRGKGRITNRPVFICPSCRGAVSRISDSKGVKA